MECQSTYIRIKSESMSWNNPGEITQFSHEVVRIFCPVVHYLVLGACGIQESDVKIKGTATNCVAIASAVMVRFRNTKASALYYRISTSLSSSRLNARSGRKVNAFCKQASNVLSVASVAISCSSGGAIQETDCQHQQHNHLLYFYRKASHIFYNRGWCNT